MSSLRASLLRRTGLTTALVLLAASLALDYLVGSSLQHQFDRTLSERARILASTIEWGPAGPEVDFSDFDMSEFASEEGPEFLTIRDLSGVSHYRSSSLTGASLMGPAGPSLSDQFFSSDLPKGESGRGVYFSFSPRIEEDWVEELVESGLALPEAPEFTIHLLRSYAEPLKLRMRLRWILLITFTVTLVMMSTSLLWAVGGGLGPIRRTAEEVRALDERDLAGRLETKAVPEEIRPLVIQFNDLLSRVQTAFERERRFSADLAHELRTPLAGLRSQLEVGLSRPRSSEEYRSALQHSSDIALRMEKLVGSLLALSRLESNQFHLVRHEIGLLVLLESAWESFEAKASAKGLKVHLDVPPDLSLHTDAALLDRILRNVLDNAVEYSDLNGEIRIEARRTKLWMNLHVSNTGCLLEQDEAYELIARFRRADPARSSGEEHSGLGLSIVQEITRILGGKLEIQAQPGGLYQVSLDFPSAIDPN